MALEQGSFHPGLRQINMKDPKASLRSLCPERKGFQHHFLLISEIIFSSEFLYMEPRTFFSVLFLFPFIDYSRNVERNKGECKFHEIQAPSNSHQHFVFIFLGLSHIFTYACIHTCVCVDIYICLCVFIYVILYEHVLLSSTTSRNYM